jgi:hypothetical protein
VPVLGIAEGQVVSTPEPDSFTEDWVTAWNRHDVDAVLAHFHDDASSPHRWRLGWSPSPKEWCAARPPRRHAAYVLVGLVTSTYLTLE